MTRETPRDARQGVSLFVVLAMAVALGAMVFFTASTVASIKSELVVQRWVDSVGTRDEFIGRFPKRDSSASALQVERLTASLGIPIAVRGREGRPQPDSAAVDEYKNYRSAIRDYLTAQLDRERRGADPLPVAVGDWYDKHADAIDGLLSVLTAGPVHWERDLGQLLAAPIPNLWGHLELQRVLLAGALGRSAAGDAEGAQQVIEASWVLNGALREEPTLITQLVAISISRDQAGVLRHLAERSDIWIARFEEHDFRAAYLRSMRFEGWVWTQVDATDYVGDGFTQRLIYRFAGPYVKYAMADVSNDYRQELHNLSEIEALCDTDLAAVNADMNIEVPSWNIVGEMMVPNLGSAIDRLRRLELDIELTVKLLKLERERERNGGVWPRRLPEIEVSAICPNDRWIYRADPEGDAMSLAFSREISWPDQMGQILPTRHTVSN